MQYRVNAAVIAIAAVIALGCIARAHSWYPMECCSGGDCYPISPDDVEGLPDGSWKIKETGEVFAGPNTQVPHRARFSPDGGFHRCSQNQDRKASTICLFVPLPNGS